MKTAVLISRDTALIAITERLLAGPCRVIPFSNLGSGLDYVYSLIPDLLVVDLTANADETVTVLKTLKDDPIFTHLPVLAVIDDAIPLPQWDSVIIEDYVWKSQLERDLSARAQLSVLRAERVVEVNPLTRLPGNISINRTIQQLIDKDAMFAIGYADLDNFKPFNDHYGFTRGDEVIKMTGRLILNIVKNRQPNGAFVGHIGGDDFIFVMDADVVEATASEIVATFDRIIPTFYDGTEREAGCIIALDRQGKTRSFPFISLSIGIASNRNHPFSHYGEITEAVSEMKQYAKLTKGSCYRSDKRCTPQDQ
ncbi:MAG: GGDEF domain-containing protein [Syntrophorhabdales bacterium]|jgi:diguanylate cyclase (GGDEF)-like protein